MKLIIKVAFVFLLVQSSRQLLYAQSNAIVFGSELELNQVKPGAKNKGKPVNWINVNTNADTWKKIKIY